MSEQISNWGNFPKLKARVFSSDDYQEIAKLVSENPHLIARGNGRSYGDASLNSKVFSTLALNSLIHMDKENGIITCQAGMLLSEILEVIVPTGFFLPVTPGTKFISLGGAIAADIHGKNHHKVGSLSNFVLRLKLINATGSVINCSPEENAPLFWQTCGGMGLTGIILEAQLKLLPISSPFISRRTLKCPTLEDTLQLLESHDNSTYSVAWVDTLAKGKKLGRSVVFLGEHHKESTPLKATRQMRFNIPFFLPHILLNRTVARAFNTLYYHKHSHNKSDRIHYEHYFFPLDKVRNWNRLYGSPGFTQYQFVLPKSETDILRQIIQKITQSTQPSFLAVLKAFGKHRTERFMSFPEEGWTLALDFKVNPAVFELLNELDLLVKKAKGRLYLAKDSRMTAQMYQSTYDQFLKSGYFQSMQSNRLTKDA